MRPTLDATMLAIAMTLATRATCVKKKVGCVLVDSDGRILATGYNGVPRGQAHCIDAPCPGALNPEGSDTCLAVHAEINALMQCRDIDTIETCYCNYTPCNHCMKTLLNTSCYRLVVLGDNHDFKNPVLAQWFAAGRVVVALTQKQ